MGFRSLRQAHISSGRVRELRTSESGPIIITNLYIPRPSSWLTLLRARSLFSAGATIGVDHETRRRMSSLGGAEISASRSKSDEPNIRELTRLRIRR